MTGIGTPRSKSKMPRPITASLIGLHKKLNVLSGILELRAACAKRVSDKAVLVSEPNQIQRHCHANDLSRLRFRNSKR